MRNTSTVSTREWQRVISFAVLVMLATLIPYLAGWLAQGDDWEFGGFVFGAEDGYSYLAKMRLGARGEWLFTLRYTSEPHDGGFLFAPYLLLGKLTGLVISDTDPRLPTALALTFHAVRAVLGVGLIALYYRFAAVFLRSPRLRFLALILMTLGGGLGWLLALAGLDDWLGSLPVDFYVPEGYSFLVLYGLPHVILARCGMLVGFLALFRALQHQGPPRAWLKWALLAGVGWLVMGLCVPFYITVGYILLGVWGLALWRRERRFPWALFWRAVVSALVVLPVLVYNAILFATNDVFGQWSAQNQLASPHPLHYVVGYIALAVPAAVGIRWVWRRTGSQPYALLAAWVIVVPVLVYLPINVQRRLAEGVIIPLSILAAAGLPLLLGQRWRRGRRVLLALVLPTSFFLWIGGLFTVLTPDRPLFHPTDELRALDRLNALAPVDAVVLSSMETGNYLPVRTNLLAYVGHGPETLESDDKKEAAKRFFAGELDPEAEQALLENVDYVFYGPEEQADPPVESWAGTLHLLDISDSPYLIYEVRRD